MGFSCSLETLSSLKANSWWALPQPSSPAAQQPSNSALCVFLLSWAELGLCCVLYLAVLHRSRVNRPLVMFLLLRHSVTVSTPKESRTFGSS